MNTEHPTDSDGTASDSDTDSNDSTSLEPRYYHLDIITEATDVLLQLGPSREPRELMQFLMLIPFDGRIPQHHRLFWQGNFPPVFLDVILDQAWYASFAVDSPEEGPATSVWSERSTSALVGIPLYTVKHRIIADLSCLVSYSKYCGWRSSFLVIYCSQPAILWRMKRFPQGYDRSFNVYRPSSNCCGVSNTLPSVISLDQGLQ